MLGEEGTTGTGHDSSLEVSLDIRRSSGYYDMNIMPVLILLNTVAISVLVLDASRFFERALLTLNIAFVQITIRMTVDKHLPSVGYQIKLQRTLNGFFCALLCLVLEGCFVHALNQNYGWSIQACDRIDMFAILCSASFILSSTFLYYHGKHQPRADTKKNAEKSSAVLCCCC